MIVLDASFVVGWLLFEEEFANAEPLFHRVMAEGAIGPVIFEIEVSNALRSNLRRERITLAERDEALALLSRVMVQIPSAAGQPSLAEIIGLSDSYDLTTYDASYVALAIRHGAMLVTHDQAMARAARAEGLTVLP